jgi:FkbH-like protein
MRKAGNMTSETKQTICITATFTAEPVAEALEYWMKELNYGFEIEFAPYNQVFQQLLDPASLIARNEKGVNIVLIRFEDWQRFEKADGSVSNSSTDKLERNISELVQALCSAADRSATPILVCICPASPAAAADITQAALFQESEQRLSADLEAVAGMYVVTSAELASLYPVKEYYDAYTDQAGHIPYTSSFFTGLATMLARKIYALQTPMRKVIAVDCDNTLWKGICGEGGPLAIEIDAPHRALQEFLVAQCAAGRLLCLCSKNSEGDVFDVFAYHTTMPLKRDHIIAWRINWQPKPENLADLAKELQLGLDSFIFLDDNPLECAQMEADCPEVLTLQLPERPEHIPRFLQHAWPFDTLKVTQVDRQRTDLYRQNMQREQVRRETSTFEDFLASLELEIQISAMRPEHVDRVAQLTQRTNQFNVTTRRRTPGEIQSLGRKKDFSFCVVEVRDRFGDYGLVGVMGFKTRASVLEVDTFLLSCRVLGRCVEHEMLRELAKIALAKECATLTVPLLPTQKNQPALDFFNKVGLDYRQPREQDGWLFVLPAQRMANLVRDTAMMADL